MPLAQWRTAEICLDAVMAKRRLVQRSMVGPWTLRRNAGVQMMSIRGLLKRVGKVSEPASAAYPSVEVFSWEPGDGRRNFGDHLARVIAQAAAARRGLTLDEETKAPRRLFTVGSVLHFARDGDTIWGSGVNGKIPLDRIAARRLDIRAVRGPKTATVLRDMGMSVPEVYGDPALLLPTLFPGRFRPEPVRDYVIVPNLHDLPLIEDRERLVSPLMGWNRCVAAIVSARFVVASSLHGIILAEAFGIPARFTRFSTTEDAFKYDDYAQGTGRPSLEPASSVEQALDMGGHPPIAFDADRLLDSFPFDLWS